MRPRQNGKKCLNSLRCYVLSSFRNHAKASHILTYLLKSDLAVSRVRQFHRADRMVNMVPLEPSTYHTIEWLTSSRVPPPPGGVISRHCGSLGCDCIAYPYTHVGLILIHSYICDAAMPHSVDPLSQGRRHVGAASSTLKCGSSMPRSGCSKYTPTPCWSVLAGHANLVQRISRQQRQISCRRPEPGSVPQARRCVSGTLCKVHASV